jgi:hypothetical protein
MIALLFGPIYYLNMHSHPLLGAKLMITTQDKSVMKMQNFTEAKLMFATLPSQWFLVPARLYAYQPLLR